MPADVRLHVVAEGFFAEGEGVVALALGVEDQGLHGLGVAMGGVFLQDLLGSFEAWRGQRSCPASSTCNWRLPFLYSLPS